MTRYLRSLIASALLFAPGQWLNYPTSGTPRGADGKPSLSAKPPRVANGKPDLSGVWRTAYGSRDENERLIGPGVKAFIEPGDDPSAFSKSFLDILVDFPSGATPMRPVTAELFRKNTEKRSRSSAAHCLPQGLPRTDINSYAPFKIIQTPAVVAVLYEVDNTHRQIYLDGRPSLSIRSRRGVAIQSADGTATPWSSTRRDSTTERGSTRVDIRTARRSAFRSGSTGAISAIWTSP